MQEEENVKPSLARLNVLLKGFVSGDLHLWVCVVNNRLVATFVTSKYVGGPAGGQILYLSYLHGLERIPLSAWEIAKNELKSTMEKEGCSLLIAHTKHENVKTLAKSLGAKVDYRLIWE